MAARPFVAHTNRSHLERVSPLFVNGISAEIVAKNNVGNKKISPIKQRIISVIQIMIVSTVRTYSFLQIAQTV